MDTAQQAILTISLLAAFADGTTDDRERQEIRRVAESLAGESGNAELTTLYQDVLLKRTDLAKAAAALTDAEAVAMMRTQVAWTGKYTAAEQTAEGIKLTARVDAASSQAIFDTDRVYFIRIDGNKLMVKSPGVIVPMTGATSIVEFELVKAD